MGIDSCIYLEMLKGANADDVDDVGLFLPERVSLVPAREYAPEGATHEVEQSWRYYSPDYERGPWPRIAGVLMLLLAHPSVARVWYFGDSGGEREDPITPHLILSMSWHYMKARMP